MPLLHNIFLGIFWDSDRSKALQNRYLDVSCNADLEFLKVLHIKHQKMGLPRPAPHWALKLLTSHAAGAGVAPLMDWFQPFFKAFPPLHNGDIWNIISSYKMGISPNQNKNGIGCFAQGTSSFLVVSYSTIPFSCRWPAW